MGRGVGISVGSGGRLLRETLEAVAGTGVGRGKSLEGNSPVEWRRPSHGTHSEWPVSPISPKLIDRDSMEALRLARDDRTVQVRGAVVPKDPVGETIATSISGVRGYQKHRDTCRPPSFAIIHWTGHREASIQVRSTP